MQIHSDAISIASAAIAAVAAFYAWWSAAEAKKANHLGRINVLMAFREHYLKTMSDSAELARMHTNPGAKAAALKDYEEADTKLREIQRAIEPYHEKVVRNKF